LPGLIDASVWIAPTRCAFCPFSDGTRTYRSSALTIPVVTVLVSPRGEPSATTGSPTWRFSDFPSVIAGRSVASFALITARSVSGSLPTIVASEVSPSVRRIETVPPFAATLMTWLLVRM
jgi:hypothetical protein